MKRVVMVVIAALLCLPFLSLESAGVEDPIDGHNYVKEDSRSRAATCTEDGFIYYVCSAHPDISYTETVSALGHDFVLESEMQADCTHPHRMVYRCQRCQVTKEESTGAALGHQYKRTVAREATEKRGGVVQYTCSICQKSYQETTPKLQAGEASERENEKSTKPKGDLEESGPINPIDEMNQGESTTAIGTVNAEKKDDSEKEGMIMVINVLLMIYGAAELCLFSLYILKDAAVLRSYAQRKKMVLERKGLI